MSHPRSRMTSRGRRDWLMCAMCFRVLGLHPLLPTVNVAAVLSMDVNRFVDARGHGSVVIERTVRRI